MIIAWCKRLFSIVGDSLQYFVPYSKRLMQRQTIFLPFLAQVTLRYWVPQSPQLRSSVSAYLLLYFPRSVLTAWLSFLRCRKRYDPLYIIRTFIFQCFHEASPFRLVMSLICVLGRCAAGGYLMFTNRRFPKFIFILKVILSLFRLRGWLYR